MGHEYFPKEESVEYDDIEGEIPNAVPDESLTFSAEYPEATPTAAPTTKKEAPVVDDTRPDDTLNSEFNNGSEEYMSDDTAEETVGFQPDSEDVKAPNMKESPMQTTAAPRSEITPEPENTEELNEVEFTSNYLEATPTSALDSPYDAQPTNATEFDKDAEFEEPRESEQKSDDMPADNSNDDNSVEMTPSDDLKTIQSDTEFAQPTTSPVEEIASPDDNVVDEVPESDNEPFNEPIMDDAPENHSDKPVVQEPVATTKPESPINEVVDEPSSKDEIDEDSNDESVDDVAQPEKPEDASSSPDSTTEVPPSTEDDTAEVDAPTNNSPSQDNTSENSPLQDELIDEDKSMESTPYDSSPISDSPDTVEDDLSNETETPEAPIENIKEDDAPLETPVGNDEPLLSDSPSEEEDQIKNEDETSNDTGIPDNEIVDDENDTFDNIDNISEPEDTNDNLEEIESPSEPQEDFESPDNSQEQTDSPELGDDETLLDDENIYDVDPTSSYYEETYPTPTYSSKYSSTPEPTQTDDSSSYDPEFDESDESEEEDDEDDGRSWKQKLMDKIRGKLSGGKSKRDDSPYNDDLIVLSDNLEPFEVSIPAKSNSREWKAGASEEKLVQVAQVSGATTMAACWVPLMIIFSVMSFFDPSPVVFFVLAGIATTYVKVFLPELVGA